MDLLSLHGNVFTRRKQFSAAEQESLSTHPQEQENATYAGEKIPVPLFPSKCLKVGHLNVNSIQGKFVELYNFLVSNILLFCSFTESKLIANEETSSFQIPGYHMLRYDRETRGGGGLVIYLSENTRYLPLEYYIRFPDETQVQCVQVWYPNIRPLIFITVYNPPRQTNKKHFASCLESLLFHVQREETEYIILGDLNIDLFETSEDVKLLNNVSKRYGLNQLICEPTRVSVTRESL
jgi:exonuclease III